ncbi:hypothetical protein KN815_20010 [Streptomyces sp. 4503]|uniref:Uncharacterized protein n=1 Tax=Streptomyces niphimycinicus TaxID=2842201 RepID=A0ABS6CHH4_9ACTN|nr:hypothetical protein [Streptomyces niphimycinicus]MBU3866266.1 hypothetical protein [Streptomyces niphimycinicus]
MKNARVALAFVSGYLFGRGHRGTLVLGLAGLAAGKRLSGMSPPGAQALKSSELGKLGQEIGSRLVSAGREAAMSAASNRIDALSDRLEHRAAVLRAGGAGGGEPAAGEHGEPDDHEEREPRERTGNQQRGPADRPAPARKRTGSEGPARRSQR